MSQPQQPANQSEAQDRRRAREKILRAKLYKIVSFACMLAALVIAVVFYQTLAKGDPLTLIRNPVLVGILFLPFVPAFVLAVLSRKNRAAALRILEPYLPDRPPPGER